MMTEKTNMNVQFKRIEVQGSIKTNAEQKKQAIDKILVDMSKKSVFGPENIGFTNKQVVVKPEDIQVFDRTKI